MRSRTHLPPPEKLAPLAARYEVTLPEEGLLDLAVAFPGTGTRHVEIGTGNGIFLSDIAAREPEVQFLGIEREPEFYWKMVKRLERAGLGNVRTMREDAWDVLEALPDQSIERVYCFFSDPWPKRRHAKNRVMQAGLLPELERVLEPGGEFWFRTDVGWYFNFGVTLLRERIEREGYSWTWVERGPLDAEGHVVTNFERKGLEAGRTPWGLVARWNGVAG